MGELTRMRLGQWHDLGNVELQLEQVRLVSLFDLRIKQLAEFFMLSMVILCNRFVYSWSVSLDER